MHQLNKSACAKSHVSKVSGLDLGMLYRSHGNIEIKVDVVIPVIRLSAHRT